MYKNFNKTAITDLEKKYTKSKSAHLNQIQSLQKRSDLNSLLQLVNEYESLQELYTGLTAGNCNILAVDYHQELESARTTAES
ncbi:MAG: hypothetical protein ABJA78_07585 [Ferruginibacter sp.]